MNNKVRNTKQLAEPSRHFPRYNIPCYLYISGGIFKVKNISLGGCSVEITDNDKLEKLRQGKWHNAKLIVPYDVFDITIKNLGVEIVGKYSNNTLGFKFTNIDNDQIALLRELIESYLEGKIISTDELTNTIMRQDLKEAIQREKNKSLPKESNNDKLKRFFVLGVYVLIIVGVIFTFLNIFYNKYFLVKPIYSFYTANLKTVKTPERGFFKERIKLKPGVHVNKNDIIGFVEIPFVGTISIVSPIKGSIAQVYVSNREGVDAGDSIISILPENEKIYIASVIDVNDVDRISIGKEIYLLSKDIDESKGIIRGRIVDISFPGNSYNIPNEAVFAESVPDNYAIIKIDLEEVNLDEKTNIGRKIDLNIKLYPSIFSILN